MPAFNIFCIDLRSGDGLDGEHAQRPHHARRDSLSRGIALSTDIRRQKFSPLSSPGVSSRCGVGSR
jgi:hypothetical protein